MSAFKIFNRFSQLLDINVTRAAAAWLRLNADGTTSQLTISEMQGELGVSLPTGTPVLGYGWTNNGDGTFSANVAGYSILQIPVTGLVEGGLYQVSAKYLEYTSGGLQLPGFIAAHPITSSAIGSGTRAVGNYVSSLTVWSESYIQNACFRADNSFIGKIGNIVIRRIG